MASETPRQSWIGRNAHVIAWVIVAVVGAFGLSWFLVMPPKTGTAPPVVQASQPQPAADTTAAARVAAERAAAERAATEEQARRAAAEHAAAERATVERLAAERATAEKAATEKADDDRAWADATQANTVAAFEAYIRGNAAGAHVAEARQQIATLTEQIRRTAEERATAERVAAERAATERANTERLAAERAAAERAEATRAADDRAWTDATQANTVAAFEAYIRGNTAGVRVNEAQQRIASLGEQARRAAEERAAAAKAADDRAWVDAAQAGTAAALEAYVRNNPAGARVADAQQRIAIINEEARRAADERAAAERAAAARIAAEKAAAEKVVAERAADDKAFAEAQQTGSISAYEAYIRNNANGAHLIAASQRIAQLRDAESVKQAAAAKPARTTNAVDSSRPYVPQRPVYKAPPLQR